MKTILFIIAFALCSVAYGQQHTVNLSEIDTVSIFLVTLNDNTVLSGKILEKRANEIIFSDITVGKVTISIQKIVKLVRISENQFCIITTNDGKSFTGIIISQNEKEITFKSESLGILSISNLKIRELKLIDKAQIIGGKYYFPNPHATRCFFGPTAIPLKKGEGYFQNAWVFANSVQVGLTDNFSIGGGMVIPLLFFITPKVGFKVSENVHVGGGFLVSSMFATNNSFGLGVGYATITLGSMENNFTINAAMGFIKQEDYNSFTSTSTYKWQMAKKPIITFSGMVRIAPKIALVSENWVFATKEYAYSTYPYTGAYAYTYNTVLSGGFRFLGEKHSFDFGLAVPIVKDGSIGLPYLDYVFKF